MLSVTLRAMRARPHPKAEEAVIETWGFYCGKCGKWAGRISWFVAKMSKERTSTTIPARLSGRSHGSMCMASRELGRSRRWCRRGKHVAAASQLELYGPWRRQRCSHQKAAPDQRDHTRACDHCGQLFNPKRSDAQYCSTRCRVAAHHKSTTSPRSQQGRACTRTVKRAHSLTRSRPYGIPRLTALAPAPG